MTTVHDPLALLVFLRCDACMNRGRLFWAANLLTQLPLLVTDNSGAE